MEKYNYRGKMPPQSQLTKELLIREASNFCSFISSKHHESMIGITDGKAVGTYIEHEFKRILNSKYTVTLGSSANGIDLPSETISTDIKVTSIRQPQSSSPFRSAMQKVFGLGYNLLLFVYNKDDTVQHNIVFTSCAYIDKERTADYQTTRGVIEILNKNGNAEDIIAFLRDRNLPADDIIMNQIAHDVLIRRPNQGYLTISNALQWRLQYQRIVDLKTNEVDGIIKIL